MNKDTHTTGIILAGGKSRRMGMEKGLALFKGQPLIHWAISILKEACSEILISSNSDCYDYLGYKVVHDVEKDSGPMGGIYSSLIESKNSKNIVLSCDMPFITSEIFQCLSGKISDAWICVPWHESDHYEPLCGIYMKESLPDMKLFMDVKNYKLPEFFARTNFRALSITEIHPGLPDNYFMNINSPSDLEIAEREFYI
jgi:molybdenum cofactor guanylyltransferase